MLPGKEDLALQRVMAVKVQSDTEQPGTLLYLVHHVLDANHNPTDALLFYECYADDPALQTHLQSSSWVALTKGWSECFAGTPDSIAVTSLDRIAGFVHLQAP